MLIVTFLKGHTDATLAVLPLLPGVIGGIGDLIGGLLGGNAAAEKEAQRQKLLQQNIDELKALGVPDEQARIQALQNIQNIDQGTTEYDKVQEDPQLRQAQIAALAQLQGLANEGGMNLTDKANLANLQGEAAAQERGARQAILQNAAARGQSGSGFELAAQLANQQGSATRNANNSLNVAAQAQARALQAMQQAGSTAGNIRNQDYGQASDKAKAQDIINQFNTANQNQLQQYKFGQQNNLEQQAFQNELQKQNAIGAQRGVQAGNVGQEANTVRQQGAGVGQGIGELGATVSNYLTDTEKKKKLGL